MFASGNILRHVTLAGLGVEHLPVLAAQLARNASVAAEDTDVQLSTVLGVRVSRLHVQLELAQRAQQIVGGVLRQQFLQRRTLEASFGRCSTSTNILRPIANSALLIERQSGSTSIRVQHSVGTLNESAAVAGMRPHSVLTRTLFASLSRFCEQTFGRKKVREKSARSVVV
jgi:hypothetical protein